MKSSIFLRISLVLILILVGMPARATSAYQERIPGPSKPLIAPTQAALTAAGLVVKDLTTGITAGQLAGTLVGQGVTVMNVKYQGANAAAGTFSGGSGIIGFDSGIILSSGAISNVVGPNQYDNISTQNGIAGDGDLTTLSGYGTNDAAILTFDFIPVKSDISFQFVFASDEYNEFVNSPYNDVFGFFVNGNNCAFVGGSPVSVNNINNGNPLGSAPWSNPELFINNDVSDQGGAYNTEMDGLTTVLTCYSKVNPNTVNRIKLAIADASDGIFDSNVFIKAGSFTTEKRPVIVVPGITASFHPCFLTPSKYDELLCNMSSGWGWMYSAEEVYEPLLKELRSAGYTEENNLLSVFWYDWRKPTGDHASRLKSRIDSLKSLTKADKVDIIAHSMGGLVSRSYIQSSSYGNDVAHLVTLGTPHEGSAKSYPTWEAANFYQTEPLHILAFTMLLKYYGAQDDSDENVQILQSRIPGVKDLLPTKNYIYNDASNQPKPESTMKERNTNIASLNASMQTLKDRTILATLFGKGNRTTQRFYVREWITKDGLNWLDGKPNWLRDLFDGSTRGDGDATVLTTSAVLPDAHQAGFETDHGGLPGDKAVINYTLSFLGISVAELPAPQKVPSTLAFYVYGQANPTVINPQGQVLSVIGTTEPGLAAANAIPNVEIITSPDGTFHMVYISDPEPGDYQIQLIGTGAGTATVGYVKADATNTDEARSMDELVDESSIKTKANQTTTYQVNYQGKADDSTQMVAPAPVIEFPLWAGDSVVTGLATPSTSVKIYDQKTKALLGEATSDADGKFSVTLQKRLAFSQVIYPTASGRTGNPVTADPRKIFIPSVGR